MQSRSDDMHRPFFYYFREDCENLNWGAAAEVFRKISKLLEIRCYQYAVLSGIILSAGGLSECLVRIYSFLQRREHFQHDLIVGMWQSSTHVKTHKLLQVCKQVVTNLFTSCQQVVFALLVPSCCNKFGSSC